MVFNNKKTHVFFLPWEFRENLSKLLGQSGAPGYFRRGDIVAIKTHFGERGNNGYIRPEFIRPVIKMIKELKATPFLTDTGTIYRGPRSNAVGHLTVAADHGFSQNRLHVPIIISDGIRGHDYADVEIIGKHFRSVKIATGIINADSMAVISHFKGHLLGGFGGAIKNLGMGCGARLGKFAMHSSVMPTISIETCEGCGACIAHCAHDALLLDGGKIYLEPSRCKGCGECVLFCDFGALSITWNQGATAVQERYAEYALGAVKGKHVFYLNFINHITPNCDCLSKDELPMLPDIGILASEDPVAVDQASLDLVIKQGGNVFKTAHPDVDCTVQLKHAEAIGLGKREYELITILH